MMIIDSITPYKLYNDEALTWPRSSGRWVTSGHCSGHLCHFIKTQEIMLQTVLYENIYLQCIVYLWLNPCSPWAFMPWNMYDQQIKMLLIITCLVAKMKAHGLSRWTRTLLSWIDIYIYDENLTRAFGVSIDIVCKSFPFDFIL